MRARFALRVLLLLLALVALPLSLAQASHAPTVSDVVAVATNPVTYNMPCEASASQVACTWTNFDNASWIGVIKPGSGNLTSLATNAALYYQPANGLDSYSRQWMLDMHSVPCINSRALAAFVAGVGNLTSPATVTPLSIPGECNLAGGMTVVLNALGGFDHAEYWINSTVILPPPPTPAPTPTPQLTAAPTATPRPTATPAATATPTASPTLTESPTASPTDSGSPSEEPSATPEQTVGGIVFSPEPSPPLGAPAPDPKSGGGAGTWTASVHSMADVSTDPATIGVSALAALLLLLFMGFVGELFNNTVKANYDEIAGWWSHSRLARLASAWASLWKGGS